MPRDWTKIPPSSTLGTILRLPLKLLPKGAVVRVRSGLNKDMRWIVGSSVHGCWLGLYELEKQLAIEPFVKPGMTVFDIGANAGFYTLAFSRLVGSEGHVWAFEPFAENANNLLRHIRLNGLSNVTLMQTAVAGQSGMNGFRIGANNSTGQVSEEELYKVPTVSLDGLLESGTVPIPDVIKMDVEGAESSVLEGSKALIEAKRTTLFIAPHSEDEMIRCRKILESRGYWIFLLNSSTSGDQRSRDDIYALPKKMV